MDRSIAKIYIDLTQLFETTSKDFIIDNLERIFGYSQTYRKRRSRESVDRVSLLAEVTDTGNIETVRAWFNRSRDNVKIPLLKLCRVSEYAKVDIIDILTIKVPVNRDWQNINPEKAEMFSQLDERDFYENGMWNIYGLISKIHSIEDYSACDSVMDRLTEDCYIWFSSILKIKTGKFLDDVMDEVKKFVENEV